MAELAPLTCFKKRCGHAECREAWNTYGRRRARLMAYGRWGEEWIDAAPVRDHVNTLRAAGMGPERIAEVAVGVSVGTLNALLFGDAADGLEPTKKIRRDRAEAILAVQAAVDLFADGARIDATGTRRRLQALAARGWPTAYLAERLGRHVRHLPRMRAAELVTARGARKVRDLYAELWDKVPPASAESRRARALARRRGWVPPMAWDDIDDPSESPKADMAAADDVDPVAIERALGGDQVALNPAEVAEVVRLGTEQGMSASQIARLTGRSARSVQRRRSA